MRSGSETTLGEPDAGVNVNVAATLPTGAALAVFFGWLLERPGVNERLEEIAKAATVDEALLSLRGTRYEALAVPWNATGDLRAVEAALASPASPPSPRGPVGRCGCR